MSTAPGEGLFPAVIDFGQAPSRQSSLESMPHTEKSITVTCLGLLSFSVTV